MGKSIISIIILMLSILLIFQNCGDTVGVMFNRDSRQSLSSNEQGGAGVYDGKPTPGTYCRVSENIGCATTTNNVRSIAVVDANKIQLTEDTCTSTALNFEFADPAVSYANINPNYIGLSRGIFKKCEVDNSGVPLPPTDMAEVLCRSRADQVDVVINKSLSSGALDVNLSFISGGQIRSVKPKSIAKSSGASSLKYSSIEDAFDLSINNIVGDAQTTVGSLSAVIDGVTKTVAMDCRQVNPQPTIIYSRDLEIDSSWIDTGRLAGYWKLNDSPAVNNTSILDSSNFATNGSLQTADAANKTNTSVPGGALSFDGVDDTVIVANTADRHLDFDTRSFSYMVWVRANPAVSNFDMPIWKGGNAFDVAGYDMELGSSNWMAMISDGTTSAWANFGNESAFVNRWVHLAVVADRGTQTLRLYADGVQVATSSIAAVGSVNTNWDLRIGSAVWTPNNFPFSGLIDDVAVWNSALSPTEVAEIYKRLRPKFY
jgi:hypothetical protein